MQSEFMPGRRMHALDESPITSNRPRTQNARMSMFGHPGRRRRSNHRTDRCRLVSGSQTLAPGVFSLDTLFQTPGFSHALNS
jgi:hypothetical protein